MPLKGNLGLGKEQILPANLEASPPSPGVNHFYQEYCLQMLYYNYSQQVKAILKIKHARYFSTS
jgi:hypothetical protein